MTTATAEEMKELKTLWRAYTDTAIATDRRKLSEPVSAYPEIEAAVRDAQQKAGIVSDVSRDRASGKGEPFAWRSLLAE